MGAKKNIIELAWVGIGFSLIKSLIASANGTGIPNKEGLFGPLRSWMYPNALRSISVKNAIATNAITMVIRIVINWGNIIIKGL